MKTPQAAIRDFKKSLRRRLSRRRRDAIRFKKFVANGTIIMGEGSYGTPKLLAWAATASTPPHAVVGRYCSIAEDVTFLVNGDHNVGWVTTYPMHIKFALSGQAAGGHPVASGPVVIENDVWIGYGSTVLGGVTIHNGAVIGAGSVVAKDVAPYTIVAGNPAREIRKRFDDETIAVLLDLNWWNLDRESLVRAVDILCAPPDLAALRALVQSPRSTTP